MLPVLRHFLDAQNYSIVKKKYNIYIDILVRKNI